MNKKLFSLFAVVLLVFSVSVSAVGSNNLRVKNTYKNDVDVYFNGVNYNKEDVSTRYILNAIETKNRVRLNGNLVISGKGFNLQLKNIKVVNSITQSVAKKSFTKEGKTFFVSEGEDVNTVFNNEINKNEHTFKIYAKTDFSMYSKDDGRTKGNEIIRYTYKNGVLDILGSKIGHYIIYN